MENLINAIEELSKVTGKPETTISQALEDYGVVSSSEGQKLFDHFTKA